MRGRGDHVMPGARRDLHHIRFLASKKLPGSESFPLRLSLLPEVLSAMKNRACVTKAARTCKIIRRT